MDLFRLFLDEGSSFLSPGESMRNPVNAKVLFYPPPSHRPHMKRVFFLAWTDANRLVSCQVRFEE